MIRALAAAGALALVAAPAAAGLRLVVLDGGAEAAAADLPPDGRWCLVWNHSVTGEEVRDCYRAEGLTLVLERSRRPDLAAARLGHAPARGTPRAEGDATWIEGIDAPLPAGLPLRVGSDRVRHRLAIGAAETALPAALAGRPVVIRLERGD